MAGHPVAHAWCVDPEHFVVDTTWEEGKDYFGAPFRAEYVRRMAGARRDYPLIDSEEMGFPLLTGAHAVVEAVSSGLALHGSAFQSAAAHGSVR